jgi:putative DNA primase/helicase
MINAMREAGIDPPDTLIDDGKLRRYAGSGDKPQNKKNWYVLYLVENGIQAGSFGRWVGDSNGAIKWCNKSAIEFTPEEKATYAKRQADLRRKQAEDRKQASEECMLKCATLWSAAASATDDHPYLQRKQVKAHGLKMMGDALLVPIRSLKGELKGLQFIKPDSSKIFKTGVDYTASVHMIGKPVDNTLIITEGYATAASIHQATGHAVLIAFVAGNLKAVAEAAKAKQPTWTLILAGDDDRWAKEPKEDGSIVYHEVPCELNGGKRINTGRVKAEEAARSAGVAVRFPRFTDTSSHPTDFNDLHNLVNLDAVRVCIFPPPIEEYNPDHAPDPEHEPDPYDGEKTPNPFHNLPFKLLGYDHGDYFYLPHGTRQVKVLRAPEHTKSHLMELAPLQRWEMSDFNGGKNGGMDVDKAANAMIQTNQALGVYDSNKLRGRGAWFDADRSVVHVGNQLIVNGSPIKIDQLDSEFIYERSIKMKFDIGKDTLPNKEAIKIEKLCDALPWQRGDISGKLLAGWCALSAICGALSWRPHIQLTGGAGCGKSWIIDNIVRPIAGPGALIVLGSTSEAGIRQTLGADARPVIFDEAEGEDQKAHTRMQQIFELARQASTESGGSIYKGTMGGTAQAFRIRSMFCFASIGISQTQQADQSRISVLTLKSKNDGGKHFQEVIVPLWKEIVTDEFCSALRARMVKTIPVIVQNALIFSDAVGFVMENKRAGDQIGGLLAGDWALRSTGVINAADAKRFVESIDWTEHKITQEQSDEQRCLAAMLEHLVRMPNTDNVSIAELIRTVSSTILIDETCPAQTALKNHGFKVVQGGFCIANQHGELKKIMERTTWPANWAQIIGRLPGAVTPDKPTWFSGGAVRTKMLPLSYVLEGA